MFPQKKTRPFPDESPLIIQPPPTNLQHRRNLFRYFYGHFPLAFFVPANGCSAYADKISQFVDCQFPFPSELCEIAGIVQ
jgi:hypothetical protein